MRVIIGPNHKDRLDWELEPGGGDAASRACRDQVFPVAICLANAAWTLDGNPGAAQTYDRLDSFNWSSSDLIRSYSCCIT